MINGELVIDNFAGGGDASTGIELATGKSVDIAINHDPEAIRMHKANHPHTKHYCEDVWHKEKYGIRAVRPLAPKTMQRIARGLKKFVLDNPEPFIIQCNHGGKRTIQHHICPNNDQRIFQKILLIA